MKSKVLKYVFECGNEETKITKKIKNRAICPKCRANLTQKKYECQKCGRVFYDISKGYHAYCKECADKIKRDKTAKWLEKNGKDPNQGRGMDTKALEDVHDRVDCIYRGECLMKKIAENPDVCLICDEYVSEFDNEERYLQSTRACSQFQ